MTPAQLLDWGVARCLTPRDGIDEGMVIASSANQVLIRHHSGRQAWFQAAEVEPAGTAPQLWNEPEQGDG